MIPFCEGRKLEARSRAAITDVIGWNRCAKIVTEFLVIPPCIIAKSQPGCQTNYSEKLSGRVLLCNFLES